MQDLKKTAAALLACLMLAGCSDASNDDGNDYLADIAEHSGYVDTLTPGTDFYGYINGKHLMEMTLDEEHTVRGTFYEVNDLVDGQLDTIIEELAASEEEYPRGSNEQMIHDFYNLVKNDYDDILDNDAEDTSVIDGMLDRINSVQDVSGLKQLWRDLTLDYGVYAFVACSPNMNCCNTSENIFEISYTAPGSLEDIKESDHGATVVRDSLADTLRTAGIAADDATSRATNIVYTLYEIAGHTDIELANGEKEQTECYNIYSTSELAGLLNNLTPEDLIYISGYSGDTPAQAVVFDPEQLTIIDSFVDNEHIQVWKDIAICTALDQYYDWLPDKYNFSQKKTTTADKMAKNAVKNYMVPVLGEIYAQRYYTEEKRETITKMCDEMKAEYYILINDADWLSEEGRALLTEKLDKMEFFIGADKPHEIDPADADLIGNSVLRTLINLNSADIKESLSEFNETPSRNGFEVMAPSTLNACYVPVLNCINITAAITNYPLYDENADYYTNLGRIGSVIGHEISHAFDSSGVKFDAYGNLRPDAMPEADIKAFKEKQDKAVEYYNKFTVLGSHVNGKLTLAENFADISGVQCVLAIAGTPENQKTVLENYAQAWMVLIPDTSAKMLLEEDTHSPAMVRANAVVACFDEFYEIYGVKEGDPMYVAPEERVRRW